MYWYWPHPHRDESRLALGARRSGDTLTVHSLRKIRGAALPVNHSYEVVRNLPDPGRRPFPGRSLALAVTRVVRRRRMLRRGFDVAHIQTITYAVDWFDLPRLARRMPVVAMVHDVEPHVRTLPSAVQRWMQRRVYQSGVDLVVFHRRLADQLSASYRVPADRVHVMPIPVDSVDEATEPSSVPNLLFFGTFRANKGLEVLMEAITLVRTPGVRWTIAGRGDAALEAAVRSFSARRADVDIDIGLIPEARKQELFRNCWGVVLPYTRFNSQSGVLADAYTAARPVIVTDVGALGDTVREECVGVVVVPNDPAELARAVERFVAEGYEQWRANLTVAAQKHDAVSVGAELRRVYECVALRTSP
jgi:glycosyltransferase involved in cell wall biosynthesis